MNTMTRDSTGSADTTGWRDVSATADEREHDAEFAREAAAYLRANGLPADEIERALCDEVGLTEAEAHALALAS